MFAVSGRLCVHTQAQLARTCFVEITMAVLQITISSVLGLQGEFDFVYSDLEWPAEDDVWNIPDIEAGEASDDGEASTASEPATPAAVPSGGSSPSAGGSSSLIEQALSARLAAIAARRAVASPPPR